MRALGSLLFVAALSSTVAGIARAETIEIRPRVGTVDAGSASPVAFRPDGFLGTSAAVSFYPRTPLPPTPPDGFYDAGIGGGVDAGAVLLEGTLVLGLDLAARRVFASSSDPYRGATRWAWSVGPFLRAYALRIGAFRFWLASGVRYVEDRQSYSFATGADVKLVHRGLGVPMSLGVDVALNPKVVLSPAFEIVRVVPLSACYDGPLPAADPNQPDARPYCSADVPSIRGDAYTVWSLTLGTRIAF